LLLQSSGSFSVIFFLYSVPFRKKQTFFCIEGPAAGLIGARSGFIGYTLNKEKKLMLFYIYKEYIAYLFLINYLSLPKYSEMVTDNPLTRSFRGISAFFDLQFLSVSEPFR
jgi:hypothetical protein